MGVETGKEEAWSKAETEKGAEGWGSRKGAEVMGRVGDDISGCVSDELKFKRIVII